MDKLRALTIYIEAFQAKAAQLASRPIAREWMEMGITADEAATWANAGYTPTGAKAQMDNGRGISERGNLTRNARIFTADEMAPIRAQQP